MFSLLPPKGEELVCFLDVWLLNSLDAKLRIFFFGRKIDWAFRGQA
jgi:hypothetical protein